MARPIRKVVVTVAGASVVGSLATSGWGFVVVALVVVAFAFWLVAFCDPHRQAVGVQVMAMLLRWPNPPPVPRALTPPPAAAP